MLSKQVSVFRYVEGGQRTCILNSLKSSYADLELKRIGGSRKKNAPFVALKGTLLPIRNVPKCNKTGHKA